MRALTTPSGPAGGVVTENAAKERHRAPHTQRRAASTCPLSRPQGPAQGPLSCIVRQFRAQPCWSATALTSERHVSSQPTSMRALPIGFASGREGRGGRRATIPEACLPDLPPLLPTPPAIFTARLIVCNATPKRPGAGARAHWPTTWPGRAPLFRCCVASHVEGRLRSKEGGDGDLWMCANTRHPWAKPTMIA